MLYPLSYEGEAPASPECPGTGVAAVRRGTPRDALQRLSGRSFHSVPDGDSGERWCPGVEWKEWPEGRGEVPVGWVVRFVRAPGRMVTGRARGSGAVAWWRGASGANGAARVPAAYRLRRE
ncbi:hypothetical protein GCM10010145_02650 [Streptomyces ruber]|uniref:Uncharacterized protein n=2 Tax=Streptomyces TaxID=1883 RepID=A0A918BA80_9ACTN|nr:hypothetical protein GCM10010145_02650 [Streptomyces ruber]